MSTYEGKNFTDFISELKVCLFERKDLLAWFAGIPLVINKSLSENRLKPFILIKYYDAVQFPKGDVTNHALIAPALIGMAFRNNTSNIAVLEHFAYTDVQSALSQHLKYAPAAGRAEAHDVQADNVRFWAASCADGPVPELGAAAFGIQAKTTAFAEEIRSYLNS